MTYKPHQIKASQQVADKVKAQGITLLAGSPRSGKTRTAIRAAQLLGWKKVLVLTKKQAVSGWAKELDAVGVTGFTVTNYEQAPKLRQEYDGVIADESHNLGAVPKPTKRVRDARRLAANCPVILLSGTPAVETALAVFHQFVITKRTPFKHRNFYQFFAEWGVPDSIYIHGRRVEQYKKCKPELLDEIGKYTVTMTQEDAGITAQAIDRVHEVQLTDTTKALINEAVTDSVITIDGKVCPLESEMAVRVALHQIETGGLKLGDDYVNLGNREVLDYLLKHFDPADTAVMAHYKATRNVLEPHYPHIYSSNGACEGVDLSHYKHFVIVNSDFSGARFIQRRERIVNMNVTDERVVHHIVTDGGISKDVYESVSSKRDFNLRSFRQWRQQHRQPI